VSISRVLCILTSVALLAMICMSELYLVNERARFFCSWLCLLSMLVSENAPAVYATLHPQSETMLQRVRPTFYLILTNHVFLPHTRHANAFVATVVIVSIETFFTIFSRLKCDCEKYVLCFHRCFAVLTDLITRPLTANRPLIGRYAVADLLFYSNCALIGYFVSMMLEIANRRAFLAHRSSIETKFHLNQQLTQQNNLLDACIPRHLCARVKQDLGSALKEWRARRSYPCKPFNELYIEKHGDAIGRQTDRQSIGGHTRSIVSTIRYGVAVQSMYTHQVARRLLLLRLWTAESSAEPRLAYGQHRTRHVGHHTRCAREGQSSGGHANW
jgi:hypothetical protein